MTDPTDENPSEAPSDYPIKTGSSSGSKRGRRNRSTELQNLLEEATKYNSLYEYEMPRGFLRDRSTKENITQGEEIDRSKESLVPKKKSKVGRPKKNSASDQKKSDPLIEKAAPNKRSSKGRLRKKHDNSDYQNEDSVLTATESSSQDSEIQSTTITRHLDDSRVRNQEKQSGDENTFVNWSASTNKIRFDIIDLEYIKSHTSFEGMPTQSTILTAKRREKFPEVITVGLQSVLFANYQEEYDIFHTKDVHSYNPMSEIGKMVEYMAAIFLPPRHAGKVEREVISPMNKAFDKDDIHAFVKLVKKYNEIILTVPRQEIIDHLSTVKHIPSVFIHDFLHMVYTRSISPHCRMLKQYEAFSSYVYGELLPGFLTEVFDRCELNPNQIFMDLGCGVGNCVVQAALECGCNLSFGCEIMPNASDLSETQYSELVQRCKLFGLKLPSIEYSLRQSFIGNKRVDELIPQCDVLLINNFLFDTQMNLQVEKLIQNAKVGCKIITLKNLRASGYTINFYNLDSILNRLHVERFDLKEDSVSWTHSGGEYYISTVMETMDESLFDPSLRQRSTRRPTRYTR